MLISLQNVHIVFVFICNVTDVPTESVSDSSHVWHPDVENTTHNECPRCFKVYKRKDNMRRHVRFECGQQPRFQCPMCPYRAKRNAEVKAHCARKHTQDTR